MVGYEASDDTWLPWKAVRELKALDEYLLGNKKLAKLLRETVTESVQGEHEQD